MRIIVTGDRNWYAPDLAEQVLNRLMVRYGPGLVIVHGSATGIDRSFAEACDDLGVDQEAHSARWEELDHPEAVIRCDRRNRPYNANAGPIRNQAMVDAGAEMCLAFHRAISSSKGTKDCVRRASAAGIPHLHDRFGSSRAETSQWRGIVGCGEMGLTGSEDPVSLASSSYLDIPQDSYCPDGMISLVVG